MRDFGIRCGLPCYVHATPQTTFSKVGRAVAAALGGLAIVAGFLLLKHSYEKLGWGLLGGGLGFLGIAALLKQVKVEAVRVRDQADPVVDPADDASIHVHWADIDAEQAAKINKFKRRQLLKQAFRQWNKNTWAQWGDIPSPVLDAKVLEKTADFSFFQGIKRIAMQTWPNKIVSIQWILAENDPASQIFYTENDKGAITGFVITKDEANTCFIQYLAVDKDCQREGNGTMLLNTAVQNAKRRGKEYVDISISSDQKPFFVKALECYKPSFRTPSCELDENLPYQMSLSIHFGEESL